jgi:hypothetical protein
MGQLSASEDTRIREFIQVLTDEIDVTKRDGGSGSTVLTDSWYGRMVPASSMLSQPRAS